MKILLSYPSEFDKGEGKHFVQVFRRLGHEVVPVNVAAHATGDGAAAGTFRGYFAAVPLASLLDDVGGADLFLYVEPLGLIPQGLEASPIPTACVISDVHRNLKPRLTMARLFDHVFLYQRDYCRYFREHPAGAIHWWPWSCDPEFMSDRALLRDLDVAFVGQLFGPNSERRRVLATLGKTYRLNEQRYYQQEEIPALYSRARIVLNLPLADDLNQRFFEALSCGALLLTRRAANGQEELYREGTHFAAFVSEEELLRTVDYYLSHETERARVAAAGHSETLKSHTMVQRLEDLIRRVTAGPRGGAPVRRMPRRVMLRTYADVYERAGRVESLLFLAGREDCRWLRARLLAMALRSFCRRAVLGW